MAEEADWTISELRRQLSNSRFDHAEAIRRENALRADLSALRERLAALVEEMRDALGNIGTLLAFTPRDVKRLDEQATRASRTIDRLAALLAE